MEHVEPLAKIVLAAWLGWLSYRQKKNEYDVNVWFAKQREQQTGKCWTTQLRKPFKIRLIRKRKKKTEAKKDDAK